MVSMLCWRNSATLLFIWLTTYPDLETVSPEYIGDFIYFIETSNKPFIDLKGANESGLLHLIKKFKYGKDGHVEFELHDSQAALVHIGKIHAMFTDKVKYEDWRGEVVDLIRSGAVEFDDVKGELGNDLANELFGLANMLPK